MTDFVFYRITILETVVCMEKGDFMYRIRLRNNLSVLQSELAALNRSGFLETKKYMQHGSTSVYRHCIAVAYISCIIAARLNIRIHIRQMIRGALLHDYFLTGISRRCHTAFMDLPIRRRHCGMQREILICQRENVILFQNICFH